MGRFERNDEGNVTNPPIIAEHERRIGEAQAAADQAEVDRLSDLYAEAREEEVSRIEQWEAKQEEADQAEAEAEAEAEPPSRGRGRRS